ncbi:aminotransferase class I/II-fold pyridoxal phosphate-dependent enzyme [Sporomusa acidovorans]|uniref:Aminotransferase n=1 Tax=Sporomusa acidovorans (strain ATCC 49682 / DSM 3132 / Mol) TaxID=1123286 RepID=A0ABZ3J447_SPOA4|nr:aminotransferase class I/II-fold pyridoxal phosphate-dependent enzyme [Sporomusa acidovorans]OZC20183.1 LL-diaminopimelate aminotransferase [Sporomusa acidovorans DSM 3132]SDD42675.1 LL-diaminopimelate aminotransferase apoenzyme [Sporomusa acidovorans]
MFEQANRMQTLASAIFTQVDDLRKTEIAAGKDVITLSIGSPDMAPAPHIVEALKKSTNCCFNYGYTLSKGVPDLLDAISQWYRKFDVELDPETEIHSLIGSQDGLAHIALCLVNPGDVVLVPDPGYPIFSAGPLIAGAELYRMPLIAANNYLPDLNTIEESVLKRAKMMILNYPNNPLAATAPRSFLEQVVAFAKHYNILVCYDFAYSDLVFDGYKPDSFLSIPGAKEIGIEFNSLSKTYNMAGCRVGYVVGNAKIISLLGRLKSNFDYGIFYPLQQAAIAALTGSQDCVRETVATYQKRRDIIVDGFNEFGWKVDRPKASMYVWAPVPTKQSSFDFTVSLIQNTGVAVIPGSAFGTCGEGYVRIALVQPEGRLAEAVTRIRKWLKL